MKSKRIIQILAAVVFWTGVWFVVATLINKELIFPSPLMVFKRIFELVTEGGFWLKTGVSLLRVVGGFLLGCLSGVLLAIISSASRWADAIVTPFVRMIRSTPVTSFIILVMLWIGYDLVPVLIAGLMVSPVMYMNVRQGISETDSGLLEVGRVYRFSGRKIVKYIYIPSVKPFFISGAVTSLGLAWKAGIAAEVICLPSNAIGREMFYSKYYLNTADLFAWTVVVVILSVLLEKLLSRFMLRDKKNYKNPLTESKSTTVEHNARLKEKGKQVQPESGGASETAVRVSHLSVGYGSDVVLKDISLDIPAGITCIMGESGRGKTTLLHTIAGLLQPMEGSIVGKTEPCALMFQDDRLFPWLSVLDNISVVNNDRRAAMELLRLVELEEYADRQPSELSGGMRRRVALARALSYDAGLMILDEPFKGLDEELTKRMARLICEKKIPVLVSTHAESDVELLKAARVVL